MFIAIKAPPILEVSHLQKPINHIYTYIYIYILTICINHHLPIIWGWFRITTHTFSMVNPWSTPQGAPPGAHLPTRLGRSALARRSGTGAGRGTAGARQG